MDNNRLNGMPSGNVLSPENGMPQMQPMQPIQPTQSFQPTPTPGMQQAAPGMNGPQTAGVSSPGGMPMVQQVQVPVMPKKDYSGLIKTIAIIILSLIAVTFIGLFIWMTIRYNGAREDVDGQISAAVNQAKDEQAMQLENEFLEREKYPFKTFAGPADYGQLTFEYPKTWSVYVAEAATSGGDFNAYFNPVQVDAVGDETINALRVTIRNNNFEEVSSEYQREMDRKDANLTMDSVTIGKDNNITANRYTGTIPGTELNGFIVIFKIRDKTAVLQTDSVFFQEDFDKLLGTVTFNQ